MVCFEVAKSSAICWSSIPYYLLYPALRPVALLTGLHLAKLCEGHGLDFAVDVDVCDGFIPRKSYAGTTYYHRLSPYVLLSFQYL